MRVAFFILLIFVTLNAGDYFAKAAPVQEYMIKSSVSGKVLEVRDDLEGRFAKEEVIVKLDDEVDVEDLKSSQKKLEILRDSIKLSKELVKNLENLKSIAKRDYERVKNLSSYSKVQKEAKLRAFINSKNSLLNAKEALLNRLTSIEDLKIKIANLKKRIEDKNIVAKKGLYIYEIYPKREDFLNPGAPIAKLYDLSKAKLTIYLDSEDMEGIDSKKIYIDSKETDYKIEKLWKVADSTNISSYRCEILIDPPKRFSKLIKVEFK
jgi:multidrug efflux pump subunit AcrA (membrane-fusion protein)